MNVRLIDYQENALDILLFTKKTRLGHNVTLMEIQSWPEQKKLDELSYIKDTIKSSWEFVKYIFEIDGVTRAFTHQFVRTRTQSYAQESQRATDVSDHSWLTPQTLPEEDEGVFDSAILNSLLTYEGMIRDGIPIQDARGLLPTNLHTSIMVATDLRTLHNTAETRLCTRTQGEYQEVFKKMRSLIYAVHPWAKGMLEVYCVNHGTCCFPRYKECPVQEYVMSGDALQLIKDTIKKKHDSITFEANPIAKDGRTQ